MNERIHLVIWLVAKTLFLYLCFLLGQWLHAKAGLGVLIVFGFAVFLTQLSDFYNQYIITKAQRLLKGQIEEGSLSPADTERNLAQIRHLEMKRNIFSSLWYLFERTGFGKTPKRSYQEEIVDFAPPWVTRHLFWAFRVLGMYFPPVLRGNLPPIKAAANKAKQAGNVFTGLSIGCGLAMGERILAKWCSGKEIPAVIVCLDRLDGIIRQGFEKSKGGKKWITKLHGEGMVDIAALEKETRVEGKPILYFLCADAREVDNLFPGQSFQLTWFLEVKHHLQGAWKQIIKSVQEISESWISIEIERCWRVLFAQYFMVWPLSRLLLCDAEDSALACQTLAEWKEESRGLALKLETVPPFMIRAYFSGVPSVE